MSNKDNGWLLPAEVDPPDRLTVCICIPDEPNHIAAFWGALTELGYQFNWQRDDEHLAVPVSSLWMSIVNAANARFNEGGLMCFNCDELNDCLAPLYAQIAALQTTVNNQTNLIEQLQEAASRGGAKATYPEPGRVPDCDIAKAYAGCRAAVAFVNDTIMDIYEAAEADPANDQNEEWQRIIGAIPVFETLPVDDLFGFTDWMFQNQMEDYQGAYTLAWEKEVACKLLCYVKSDCELDANDITYWLYELEPAYPTNKAAQIFTRLGTMTGNGLQQQIGKFINDLRGGQTITDYFDDMIVAFGVGAQQSDPGYADCDTCECKRIFTTQRMPADFEVTIGTGPIPGEGILIHSANYVPHGNSQTVAAELSIPVTNATRIGFVVDRALPITWVLTCNISGNSYETNPASTTPFVGGNITYLDLPAPITGTLTQFEMQSPDGDQTQYNLLTIIIEEEC